MTPLSDLDVENVFIYVGDAVRWDMLPERTVDRGLTIKTVAASIHTPTSFSSLTTGLYPPQHGVAQFGDKVSSEIPSLFTLEGIKSIFANTINEKFNENPDSESILHRTLSTTESPSSTLSQVEPPFVFLERGPGGHAPYGDFPGNGWEYYRNRKAMPASTYREEYSLSLNQDRDYFESRIEKLDSRELLEDTLVIYTSDHGELLGESGCLGHNAPIHPKLIYVPTVFCHPSLDQRVVSNGILRHVDILPTIASLFNENLPDLPGRNLTVNSLPVRGACFYRKSFTGSIPGIRGESEYESVWDHDGGYIYSQTGHLNRSIIFLGKLFKSAKREYMRRHFFQTLRLYLAGKRQYGTPSFTEADATEELSKIGNLPKTKITSSTLDDSAEERLRELGYLN